MAHRAAWIDQKPQVMIAAAVHVSAERRQTLRVVELRQEVGLNVGNLVVCEHCFQHAARGLVAMPHAVMEVAQRVGQAVVRLCRRSLALELFIRCIGEGQHGGVEFLINGLVIG